MIRANDTIRILPEFADPGDENCKWIALEDEDGGRVRITCLIPGMTFCPQSIVSVRMIEVVAE